MITRIEALNYRCLRYVRQDLGPFHVLVGPNASGKTTFLDVIAFLGTLVSDGPEAAVVERTQNFRDLVWGRQGDRFELALEAAIPDQLIQQVEQVKLDVVRYEVAIGFKSQIGVEILSEKVLLKGSPRAASHQKESFPAPVNPEHTILTQRVSRKTAKTVISKIEGGNDNYYSEVRPVSKTGWELAFKLGPRKSALGNLPADDSKFPVTTWLKGMLSEGVQQIALNSMLLRRASPPLRIRGFKSDGSNIPWMIESLRHRSPEIREITDSGMRSITITPFPRVISDRFRDWIAHLQTALPDIEDIRTVERPDDKHRYLMIRYRGDLEVPSWMASDGTLRLLALTLPAYLSDFRGIYLIEEPENGIHPRAVETMFQSLSSVYEAQILMATHSPVILSLADLATVLCFAKTDDEATDIVLGSEHPSLRDWRGETNLGTLFAAGVLG
jgi:predicted ATPase